MSDGSAIEWCDATWTIAVGCTRVSAGCDHCYAMHFTHRGLHETHRGLTKLRPKDAPRPGVDWNGTVRTLPERLADPLKWRKPRRVFVGSMTDLFHPAIPFEYIAAVFGVMAACPQHTFLVLTKRPERAREFFAWVVEGCREQGYVFPYRLINGFVRMQLGDGTPLSTYDWPLPNVHLGTSVEDQATADARIPELLRCPATLHWVSAEPLLGPVDLVRACVAKRWLDSPGRVRWIVVGGESGARARPFDVQWARAIVHDCKRAGVPVFVKQLGSNPLEAFDIFGITGKGNDPEQWPGDLRVREVPT